jgi:glutathione S-transferase
MKLCACWRSASSCRVRIVLTLKDLQVEQVFVHLARSEQHAPAYQAINPQAACPLSCWTAERS